MRKENTMTEKKGKRWVAMSVDIFDQPLLAGEFDKRSAWMWMVANAAWKDHEIKTRAGPVILRRGQVLAGRKQLAETWGWSEKQVRTFLHRLTDAGCIKKGASERASGRAEKGPAKGPAKYQCADVVTICKYEEYQGAPKSDTKERASEGASERASGRAEKGPDSTKDYNTTQNTKERHTCAFAHFWSVFPDGRKRAKPDAEKRFKRIIANGAATADELIAAVKASNGIDPEFPPMPSTWLNQQRWLDEPQGKKAIVAKKREIAQSKPEPAWMEAQREVGRRQQRAMGVPEHEIF